MSWSAKEALSFPYCDVNLLSTNLANMNMLPPLILQVRTTFAITRPWPVSRFRWRIHLELPETTLFLWLNFLKMKTAIFLHVWNHKGWEDLNRCCANCLKRRNRKKCRQRKGIMEKIQREREIRRARKSDEISRVTNRSGIFNPFNLRDPWRTIISSAIQAISPPSQTTHSSILSAWTMMAKANIHSKTTFATSARPVCPCRETGSSCPYFSAPRTNGHRDADDAIRVERQNTLYEQAMMRNIESFIS